MKTLLPNKDFSIENNEMYFYFEPQANVDGCQNFTNPFNINGKMVQVTHSTASLQGVKQLDRSLFVKAVDVKELARKRFPLKENSDSNNLHHLRTGFFEGYNANKNEFDRGQMLMAMHWASNRDSGITPADMANYLNQRQPLSLPASITINGDDIIIKW